ncbi:unnamed protein product, partial [Dicrocoelium dendriticum]
MKVSSLEDADRLQTTLDLLHNWSNKWQLPVNSDQCSVLSVGSSNPFGDYHIGGSLLSRATQERDLGVIVSSDLESIQDTQKQVAAAHRKLYSISKWSSLLVSRRSDSSLAHSY